MIASKLIEELSKFVDSGCDYEVFYHDADEGELPVNNLQVLDSVRISYNTKSRPGIVIG